MYIYIGLILFLLALLLVLLSYTPWVQGNLKWMTSFYFYIGIGAGLGACLLYAAYLLALKVVLFNQ